MSKIDQLLPGQTIQAPQSGQPTRPQSGVAFKDVLDQATQAAQSAQTPPKADPLANASPTTGVAATTAADGPSPLQSEGLSRAGRTLDLLDSYALALADQGKSLKDMAGLVRSLENEAKGLDQVIDRLDPQDELYGILREVSATAQAQSLKFNRGDYIEG